ncbi:MAG: ABC transporter permease [Phycisphaerales bacterium]|nr:ABC transporter permease [Phycisphaerales bacterium]
MNAIAIKMLLGDRAKYLGILLGVTLTSFLITQQGSIFVGIMSRTFGFIVDTSIADIWVMDEKVQFVDDSKPMQDTMLLRVRGVEGVDWAMPLYKSLLRARLDDGNYQQCNVIGVDDTTLVGGPSRVIAGHLEDLRAQDAVIVDAVGAARRLAKIQPDGTRRPLGIGDTLELNDSRAVVVGLCQTTRTFQSQPVVYTTYSRATRFAPRERRMLTFILVKAKPGEALDELCARIRETTGLAAYTGDEFSWMTVMYFIRNTGIPINFGTAVILAFLVGTAIAGQQFYNFTHDNLRYLGALKAMGAGNLLLLRMVVLQALLVGLLAYGLGVGLASAFGYAMRNTELAFRLLPQQLYTTGVVVLTVCALSAAVSMIKVVRLEPAVVFKN